MPDLKTTYMGIPLQNPLIVGSSTHTGSLDSIKKCAEAGAGAIVLRSIFEEQIQAEVSDMVDSLESQDYPEAYDYIRADFPMQIGPEKYLDIIRQSKEEVTVPIIASLNCTTHDHWVSYARKIEIAGADGLELNVYDIAHHPDENSQAVEQRHLKLVQSVSSELSIPVSVKLGASYTALGNFVNQLTQLKVQAIVLFNRFFQPDIDIERLSLTSGINFSRAQDAAMPVRWIALLRHQVACDIAMTTGVHDASAAIKGILAGANVFQICSALYTPRQQGVIESMLTGISAWMEKHGFEKIDDFRGRLAASLDEQNQGFARAQYVKGFLSLES